MQSNAFFDMPLSFFIHFKQGNRCQSFPWEKKVTDEAAANSTFSTNHRHRRQSEVTLDDMARLTHFNANLRRLISECLEKSNWLENLYSKQMTCEEVTKKLTVYIAELYDFAKHMKAPEASLAMTWLQDFIQKEIELEHLWISTGKL